MATLSQRFGKAPSEYFGFTDRGIALDFDRAHNLRLALFEAEKAKREADALSGNNRELLFSPPDPQAFN